MSLDDAAIRTAFDELDADGSGSLDRSEIATLAKSLDKPLSEVELDVAMQELDKDANGSVSFDEFKLFWRQKFGGHIAEGTKLAAIMAQWSDLRPIPGVAYHPDRYVDPDDEFRARVWATFDKIDANNDQEISYIEFINWWKKQDKAAHGGHTSITDDVLMNTRAKFREFDTNQSCAIDRDELAGLLRAMSLEKYVESAEAVEAANGPPPMAPKVASVKTETEEPICASPLFARAPDSMFKNLLKKGTNQILPPRTQLGTDGHFWEEKEDAMLTKSGISWERSGKLKGPVPLANIKRAETCEVPSDKGFGIKVSLNAPDQQQAEYIFAVEDEEDRDEWINSIKMVMMQELNPKSKKESQLEERAKNKGKAAPKQGVVDSKRSILAEKVLKEQVNQAFQKFDADGSGTLDTKEIGAIASAVGKTFTQEELDEMCEELDRDKSGTVDYAEFEAWWCRTFSGELVEGSNLAAVMAAWTDIAHVEGVAYHPDRYVDPDDEFRARVWYLFDDIDSNHDRHISYVEFINWWKQKDREVHHGVATIDDATLQETREKFNQYDTNGNSTIDRDELAGLLRALDLVSFIPEVEDLVDDDSYKIVVHTAAHKEAGTDSKVSMTLYGEDGDSGARVLTTARNRTFERGQISTLRITSADLGALTKLKIGHDNSGTEGGLPGKGWYLSKIVVSRKGMEPITFTADRWLDTKNAPDKQCEVTLTPGLLAKKKEKKTQKDDKVMYINPVYGPGGDIAAGDAAEKLDPLGNPNRRVTIIGADDLINADLFDKSDPYCVVFWNGKKVGKTSTIDNTTYPRWNEDFTIQLPESGEGFLRCELYDHDMFGGDDPLGTVEFKLGGPDNRPALLKTANYPFPDEKYSGFLTLRVDHAASRFASEGAFEFKDKWMQGMTYREHREKHVFEEWTRWYIMVASALLAVISSSMLYSAIGLATCEANNSGYLSTMYMIVSPFALVSALAGIYGAFRVKQDVLDETGATEAEDAESGDDDGLQTTGQRILEFYNMCCVLIFVSLTVIIAETWVLEVEEARNDTGCEDALGTLNGLMWTSFVSLIMLAVLIYANTLIVSVFEVLQTMAEFLALFLVIMGVFISVASAFVVKQTICLDISAADGWPAEAYMFLMLGIFGMLTVAVSFLGFVAAYQESMKYLLFHASALGLLAVYGVVAVAYVGSTSATEFFTGTNCVPMLTTLSEDLLWERFGAVKYDGRGMSRNQSDPDLSWMPVRGPAEAPSCFPKSSTQFYWEDNQNNPDYLDAGSGQVYDASGEKILYGCLNDPRACEHIAAKMSAYDMSILAVTLWLMIIIIGSIATSLWLRKETSMVGHVLIHHHAKLVFWIMKIALLICMIILPFMFTGGECGTPHPARAEPLKSTLEVVTIAAEAPSSCFDEMMNGDETDVDCGGSCDASCQRYHGCKTPEDCCADPENCDWTCTGVEPRTATCYDTRCIEGQVAMLNETFVVGVCRDGSTPPCRNGLVGTCDIAFTCNNGVRDADAGETGVDCGGSQCEPCACLGDNDCGCLVDADCAAEADPVYCNIASGSDVGQCFSCTDQEKNGDESDIDCGGSFCEPCPEVCIHSQYGLCDCRSSDDCQSSNCFGAVGHSVCVSYTNGVRDGDETDIDCGGSSGVECNIGQCCEHPAECASGRCEPAVLGGFGSACASAALVQRQKACMAAELVENTCQNFVKDYDETGLDCGGYECRTEGLLCPSATCTLDTEGGILCPADWQAQGEIAAGQGSSSTCERNEDCQSGRCAAPDGADQAFCFSCDNSIMDGDEFGIDCGNSACGPCDDGDRCTTDDHCADVCILKNSTDTFGRCASRSNGVVDGGETGVDCGGAALLSPDGVQCSIGEGCNADGDCVTGNCDLDALPVPQVPALYSQVVTPDNDTALVADLAYWNIQINGRCERGSRVEDTCIDGLSNGDESDLDCGGLCATQGHTCADGQRCTGNADCDSGSCDPIRGTCVSCGNGIRDGDETDIDCGGPFCGRCETGQDCAEADDCSTGICVGEPGISQCASCTNRLRDGDETGIDCGGACPNGCPIRQCMSDGSTCGNDASDLSEEAATCSLAAQITRATQLGQPSGPASCVFATCNSHSDCATGFCDTQTSRCQVRAPSSTCQDGAHNVGSETDRDCGGDCAVYGYRCAGGLTCVIAADCESGVCFNGLCGGQCDDGIQNGGETDEDCGGECGQCLDGKDCQSDDDCLSRTCSAALGICTSCFNNIRDGDELGEDCGGSCNLQLCPLDSSCENDSDCLSNQCSASNTCSAQTDTTQQALCSDGLTRMEEPDRDCGGPCLLLGQQCVSGQGCFDDVDCRSGMCHWNETSGAGRCVSCSDGVQNGLETDIDCGGRSCAPCSAAIVTNTTCNEGSACNSANEICVASDPDADISVCVMPGSNCRRDDDCSSGVCADEGSELRCVSCFDGFRNGDEGDTDCGGQCALLCGVDQACNVDSDCNSGFCRHENYLLKTGTCQQLPIDQSELLAACQNGVRDTNSTYESDTDCGGDCRTLGQLCGEDESCSSDADCAIGKCNEGRCLTCTGQCGGDCSPCIDGRDCDSPDDCVSGQCTGGTCTSCTNGILDGHETATDCGGDCSRHCSIGLACETGADCVTRTCVDETCVATSPSATCNNTVLDGDETDLDCGGSACVALGYQCDIYQRCSEDSDCLSRMCGTSAADSDAPSTCVSCYDNIQNGQETDTDCGGDVCSPCTAAAAPCDDVLDYLTCTSSPPKMCRTDSDCTDSCYEAVTGTSHCVSSTNGIKDGQEGGIDCGFHADSLCAVNSDCEVDTDCATGYCDATTTKCIAQPADPVDLGATCDFDGVTLDGEVSLTTGRLCRLTCENGRQDGTETDVDCGGEFCRNAGYTCSAGDSNNLPDKCAESADCGAGACSLIQDGLECSSTSDCVQGYSMTDTLCYIPAPRLGYCSISWADCSDDSPCPGGAFDLCIVYPGECIGTCSSCSDGRRNGAETDVDCGGGSGGCDGCSVGQSCACGVNSATGRCGLHRDCAGTLQCYAPLPADGLPTGTDRSDAIAAAQAAAVCIRPASVGVYATTPTQAEAVVSVPGASVLSKISVAGSNAVGVENLCTVTAIIATSGGVRLSLPNYATRLAASAECATTSVTSTSIGMQIVGPFTCVNMALSELRLDTTCDSAWIEAETPAEDRVEVTVLASLSSADAACNIGTDTTRLYVNLVGRPQLHVTGVAINGDCISTSPDGCADERSDLAIVDVEVLGSVESCGVAQTAETMETPCSGTPHPDGLPGGCCDTGYQMGSHLRTCPQLLHFNFHCDLVLPTINMPAACPDTCGRCPAPPPPPPPLSTRTPTVPVADTDTSATSQGMFSLDIPLGMTGASDGNVLLTLSKAGYVDTTVVVPVTNGNIDVGHITMVSESNTVTHEIQGSCLDLYSTDAQREALASSSTEMTATLYEGQIVFPARPETAYRTPAQSNPSSGTSLTPANSGIAYRFSDIPTGTYTVVCEVAGIRADRFVYAAPLMPPVDAVAIPTLYTEDAVAGESGGLLSEGGMVVSVDWQVIGDRGEETRPDLDISGMFQATQDQSCHIFTGYPSCGDVELMPDLRGCNADPADCPLLDGPVAQQWSQGTMSAPTEAIIIRQVRGAIYTFYAQYSNANTAEDEVLYPGVDPTAFLGSEYLRVVEVYADVFAGGSKIAHTVGTFEVPGTTPYMRLFCIDATSGAPKVFSAVMMSETPPEMCTSCPC